MIPPAVERPLATLANGPATAVATSATLAATSVTRPGLGSDLAHLGRRAGDGDELAPQWARLYARHRIAALDDIARAWALSEQLGCPIGDALRAATTMLREQVDLQRRIAAATAGPRATMQLLTALPILGVAMGFLTGEGTNWRKDPPLRRVYAAASWIWVGLFFGRLAVQVPLYWANAIGALGVVKIVMGVPLYVLAAFFTFRILQPVWAAKRAVRDQA